MAAVLGAGGRALWGFEEGGTVEMGLALHPILDIRIYPFTAASPANTLWPYQRLGWLRTWPPSPGSCPVACRVGVG